MNSWRRLNPKSVTKIVPICDRLYSVHHTDGTLSFTDTLVIADQEQPYHNYGNPIPNCPVSCFGECRPSAPVVYQCSSGCDYDCCNPESGPITRFGNPCDEWHAEDSNATDGRSYHSKDDCPGLGSRHFEPDHRCDQCRHVHERMERFLAGESSPERVEPAEPVHLDDVDERRASKSSN